ncbi:hypothetical protein [Sphingobium sp. MK2]|uniref:hypothetical protein n=1 Tax=Sphingobium sp. MK2 TaxID=3116540 RepID=UPI0032E36543
MGPLATTISAAGFVIIGLAGAAYFDELHPIIRIGAILIGIALAVVAILHSRSKTSNESAAVYNTKLPSVRIRNATNAKLEDFHSTSDAPLLDISDGTGARIKGMFHKPR